MSPSAHRCALFAVLLYAQAPLRTHAQAASPGNEPTNPCAQGQSHEQVPGSSKSKSDTGVATANSVRAALEPAYLAYPVGSSGLDPLIFESNLVAHFIVHQPGWPFMFVLTPKISVRMFAEPSVPVSAA